MRRALTSGLVIAHALIGMALAPGMVAAMEPSASALGFELRKTRVAPKRPYFDGPKPIRLHYGFAATRAADLRIRVVHRRSGNTVRVWRERGAEPGTRLERAWSGLNRRGRSAKDGGYAFRVGPVGRPDRYAGKFELRGHVHPVDGPHGDRGAVGQFGAGRSGGRIHDGYDILADCGTPLVAARGGKVVTSGYDDRLYGWFVRINAHKSAEQYFYSHLIARPRAAKGDRVRTGELLGDVGRTGNARSTPCHLHFEVRDGGTLVNPKPLLGEWEQ